MQPCAADESPTIPTVDLYRRGSATNVNTLHFAGALRSRDQRLQLPSNGELQADKTGWCKYTKVAARDKDLLKMELRRNLRRRGYVDARESARHITAVRARSASPGTKKINVELHKRQITQLEKEERMKRREIANGEFLSRQKRERDILLVQLSSLLDDEFTSRKDIFRDWLTSLLLLKKAKESQFEDLTGVSPSSYVLLVKIQEEQERQRQLLYREYNKQVEYFSKMILLLNLEAIEIEINKCHLKEMQIKQRQQLK